MVFPSALICFLICHIFIIHKLVHCHCPKEFHCGGITFGFPFANRSEPNCGLLLVDCDSAYNGYPTIQNWMISGQSKNKVWVVPFMNQEKNCYIFKNFTLPKNNSAISFYSSPPSVTMLKCHTSSSNQTLDSLPGYKKFSECEKELQFDIYYNYSDGVIFDAVGNEYPSGCSPIQWPIGNREFDQRLKNQLFYLLELGFQISFDLYGSCKECYLSGDTCKVDLENLTCSKEGARKVGLIVSLVLFGVIITIFAIIVCWFHRSINPVPDTRKFEQKNIEKFLKSGGSLGPQRYSYAAIKSMTSSFKHKIGQGGFGSVFKGFSIDGTPVAVKLLNESKGNGEDFINEVASISKTSHVNIVKLLGFCFKGSKRALVYEFMPKGSLEKFIFHDKSSTSHNILEMPTLFKIAIGIARGLEYLHRLCATRIVHFDVKPHNVLLDEEFTPKISDFGLAKSSLREQNSILTFSGARGTIGYIAPEVVCRYLGSVSHKSDVYSYGMMVLEIVGGRRNVDDLVDNSSQMYLPHWIYNQIETNQDFDFLCNGNDEDKEFARKMIIVSFWCIQTDPSSRPTMTKVVEMLESKSESLPIPPRLYLFSAANSPFNKSTLENQMRTGMVDDDFIFENGSRNPSPSEETVLLKDMKVSNSPVSVTDGWVSGSTTLS